jgi:protein-L-isoaspartate(D-aspartate) O-methyltransferase
MLLQSLVHIIQFMASGLKELVQRLRDSKTIQNKEMENAFLNVPREIFFPKESKDYAYVDTAFSIGPDSTISQPTTIAMMLSLLEVEKGEKVLEVGSGSGYVLALLHKITNEKVYGIEMHKNLVKKSKDTLNELKIPAHVVCGDGKKGFLKEDNFDKILISAACGKVPNKLFKQLKDDGLLIAPIGERVQLITVYNKKKEIIFQIGSFVFVELR